MLALSALNFDLSVYDIFGLLAAGGALVIPPPAAARDPEDWITRIQTHKVTLWNTVPQLMRMLVEYDGTGAAQLESLRLVMMSGDWITTSLPGQIRAVAPDARLYSLGGATEASIWSIFHPIEMVTDDLVSIPYGRPLTNQSFHVLDRNLAPRPDWTDGELYIGGRGLAIGYWRNPEETNYRFVIHPGTGERLYRTGDLGRALPDGTIELLGRVDFQVKIQGHRIELGEIEHVLARHPMVRDAAVEARADDSGQKRLVAYVVTEGGPAEDLAETLLRDAAEELPRYMVPSLCMIIEALPLSANGKLDRKRLPEPNWATDATAQDGSSDEPETALERELLRVVREVLGVPGAGLQDNVFDLGGNSVQMVRINRRLREQLNRSLPVAEMFNHATLASYARHLEASAPDPVASDDAEAERAMGRRAAMARRRARVIAAPINPCSAPS